MATESPGQVHLGYWLVAYLDLLGIRRELAKTNVLPGEDPKKFEDVVASLRASVGAIRNLRAGLANYFEGLSLANKDDSVFDGLPADKIALAKSLQGTRVRRDHIADGVVVACPLGPEIGHFPIRAVWEVLGACSAMMLIQLAMRRPVRVGMDVGTAIEHEGELYGAAYVNAYEIESRRARYPRIVVGNALPQYLQQLSQPATAAIEDRFKAQMAQWCASLLKRDADGEWILDYAGPRAHEFYMKQRAATAAGQPDALEAAREFAREARETWRDRKEGDGPEIFWKYSQLVRYLDACGPLRPKHAS